MSASEKGSPVYSRHVDDLWKGRENTADLLAAAEAVERTIESSGYQAIKAVLAEEIATIDRKLAGPAMEQAEYARLLGTETGLSALDEVAKAITERAVSRRQTAEAEIASQRSAGESAAER